MARINLTDRFIGSKTRVPTHGRVDYFDAVVPGLALRVASTGHRSFVLIARYPTNPKNPTRRTLGEYGEITLEQAREKARHWLALIQKGIDPQADEARQRAVEQRRQVNTFASVARQFIDREVKGAAYVALEGIASARRQTDRQITAKAAFADACKDPANEALVRRMKVEGIAKKDEAIRAIEGDFVQRWGKRPITDIQPEECAEAVRAIVSRGTPYEAHNRLGHLRRMFNWAIGTHEFGIFASPVERLAPKDLIGSREARSRVLLDAELSAVWNAAGGPADASEIVAGRRRDVKRDINKPMGYPYGPLIRMLILTGQREREVAEMSWSEIDFAGKMWTIPAERMKGDRIHEVPLPPMALSLLASVPRFSVGGFVFSTTSGAKPVAGFSKAKERIDLLSGVTRWKFHDLRRTVRTHFSALPVQDLVRELVIAHARPGLHKVYDQHSYRDEKRQCLELWENRLAAILEQQASAFAIRATP